MIAFCDVRDAERMFLIDAFGEEHFYTPDKARADILSELPDVDTLCVFVSSKVDKEVIDALPDLKHITTRSTGVDHIDVKYAKKRRIVVSHVPGYGEYTVAEFAFALLLTLSRKIFEAYHQVREKGDYSFTHMRGFDLYGKTFGILGTGRIGSHAARIAKGFGMKVLAYDVKPNEQLAEEIGFTYTKTLDEMLQGSDVVSLHIGLFPETRHIIGKKELALMKKGAILINTARGELIDTTELVKALKSGHLGGAGLDVLEGEKELKEEAELILGDQLETDVQTLLEDHILIDMPNVIVTPHMAFYTEEAEKEIIDTSIANIDSFYTSGKAKHIL